LHIFVPMKRQFAILAAGLLFLSFTADKPAYVIYNSAGKDTPFSKMMKSLYKADVILFGEYHDNPISHWLQKEVTLDLYGNDPDALSEPLEEDNWTGLVGFIHQVLHDEYLSKHPAPEDCEYYMCGPPLMNSAVTKMLHDLGVEEENILFDDFG